MKGVKAVTYQKGENHPVKDSDEHYTPKILFDYLNITFGTDVSAPVGGIPWIPAINYYDKERDGLTSPWFGTVWMNPPFSRVTPWVDRFIEHNDGIALLVVSRSKWFARLWNCADAITPFPENWKFERPDGKAKKIAFQTMLFGLGNTAVKAMSNLPETRIR